MGMVGMKSVADALGLSIATVSRALRHDPSVRLETQKAVYQMAEQLGYSRNAYVGEFMSSIRRSQSSNFKGNLGLLWGGQIPGRETDSRLRQIQKGVQIRAEELGYGLSEFWLGGQKPEALARILLNRGIQGILVAVPSFSPSKAYLRFDFSSFASVAIGWGLLRPTLHRVRFDYFQAMQLALHHSRHAFGSKIAAIWNAKTDVRANRVAQASFLVHHPAGPAKAAPLFLDAMQLREKPVLTLIEKRDIECLLVEPSVRLPIWLDRRIPANRRVVFRDPGSEECFGWVDTQNSLLGRWGVDLLTAKLSQHERGLPESCQVTLIPPIWVDGKNGAFPKHNNSAHSPMPTLSDDPLAA